MKNPFAVNLVAVCLFSPSANAEALEGVGVANHRADQMTVLAAGKLSRNGTVEPRGLIALKLEAMK